MLAKWALGMSTWSGDGHFPASYSHFQRSRGFERCAAATAEHCGEAADCGRDVGTRRVGSEGGAGARSERESGVWLAATVLGGTTWGAEARDQVAAGAREREPGGTGDSRALRRRLFPITSRHDSHRVAASK